MRRERIIFRYHRLIAGAVLALFGASSTIGSAAVLRPQIVSGTNGNPALIPTGQYITPTLAPGATYQRLSTGLRADGNADADSAMSSALSPDGRTLLVLTSGFNTSTNYENKQPILFPVLDPLTGKPASFTLPGSTASQTGYNQSEFVFIYDVTSGYPVRKQIVYIPDTYNGIVWDPAGTRFFVSGGIDDRILIYKNTGAQTTSGSPTVAYVPDAPFIILGHNANDTLPIPDYHGGDLSTTPAAHGSLAALVKAITPAATVAGFDLSRDGKTIVAANFHNESVSIVDVTTRKVIKDVVFTPPGTFTPIGELPYWVSVKSDPRTGAYQKAYVSSQRDDQVVVVSGGQFTSYIKVPKAPNKMVLDAQGHYLYVACGDDDSVAVIDTTTDTLVRTISLARPGDRFKGASPDSLRLDPTGRTLYVTLGGENALAVVDVRGGFVRGRIPVGWQPTSVEVSANGTHLFVVNEKSNAGPNPGNVYYSWNTAYGASTNPTLANEYTWELEKSGLVAMPVPDAGTLSYLSQVVDVNNGFQNRHDDPMMAFLRTKIKHVIYIVNENRTFDQVFGDLNNGSNGDPRLTFFTQPITPNMHALESNYVTLDNFYDSSETSGVGWNWVMQGHTNDYTEKTQPVDYGNGSYGFTYDWQGVVENINLGLPPVGPPSIFTTRITGIVDPSGRSTILPSSKDPVATLGADNLGPNALGGYIWESLLRNKLSYRNYGWQIDLNAYSYPAPFKPPLVRNPYPKYLQSSPVNKDIRPYTDEYYRAFDMNYPDIYRIEEWKREFAGFVANNDMPSLMTMTIPHDHTGSFKTAIEGLNTPQLELADHDYAIGQLVEAVSHSKFWDSTAIIMLEDDPQDGQDHVEAHRSIIHIISPWTKSHAVVHTTYFSTSALRTVEALLGINPLGLNDANAQPISDAFTTKPTLTAYTPIVPGLLCKAPVKPDLVPACSNPTAPKTAAVMQLHDGAWWAAATDGLDFSHPDHVNPQYFNAILEYGITGRGELPARTQAALASHDYDGDGDGR